jgi:hypothetical protein
MAPRFARASSGYTGDRRDVDDVAMASRLADRVAQLRAQAAACRAQVIALNARLSIHEHVRDELRALRQQLIESSARLDHAVDDIGAVTALQQTLASLPP